jgi:hypothetical protein
MVTVYPRRINSFWNKNIKSIYQDGILNQVAKRGNQFELLVF